MFSKGLSMCRGSHGSPRYGKASVLPMAIGIVGMASGTVAMLGQPAWASNIIYQDSFTGSSTTPLNGAAPTVDNGPSATWTATGGYAAFADSGYTSESNNAGAVAYLNFTPVSGNVYTLSATLYTDTVYPANPQWNWLAVGFVQNPTTASGTSFVFNSTDPGAMAWAQDFAPNAVPYSGGGFAAGAVYSGPDGGDSPFVSVFSPPSGSNATAPQDISVVLNTGSSAWTYQFFDNGSAVSAVESFTSNPAITAVGLNLQGPGSTGGGSLVTGQVSNFSLTSSPVPEPASIALLGICAGAVLLLKRRRTV